jgi:hypothetical protein
VLELVLSRTRVVGTIEDGDGVAVVPAEAHGQSLLGSFHELGWHAVLVGRGRVIVSADLYLVAVTEGGRALVEHGFFVVEVVAM